MLVNTYALLHHLELEQEKDDAWLSDLKICWILEFRDGDLNREYFIEASVSKELEDLSYIIWDPGDFVHTQS